MSGAYVFLQAASVCHFYSCNFSIAAIHTLSHRPYTTLDTKYQARFFSELKAPILPWSWAWGCWWGWPGCRTWSASPRSLIQHRWGNLDGSGCAYLHNPRLLQLLKCTISNWRSRWRGYPRQGRWTLLCERQTKIESIQLCKLPKTYVLAIPWRYI